MSNNGIPPLNDWQADNYPVIYDESESKLNYVKTGSKIEISTGGSSYWEKNEDDQFTLENYAENVMIQPLGQNTGDGVFDIATPVAVAGPLAQWRNADEEGTNIPGCRIEKNGGVTVGHTSLTGVPLPLQASDSDVFYSARISADNLTDIRSVLQVHNSEINEFLTELKTLDINSNYHLKEIKYKRANGTGYYLYKNIGNDGFSIIAYTLAGGNQDVVLYKFYPSAEDGATAYILNTQIAHTSGKLLEVKNNDVEKFSVDFAGVPSTNGNAGVSGSFVAQSGETITVTNGLITAITPP